MNINKIKSSLLEQVKEYDVSEFSFSDVLKVINNKFVNNAIKKANVYNIKRHILKSRNSSNSDEFKKAYSESLSFDEREKYIFGLFSRYTKEDKISECMPHLNNKKLLNDEKLKYFVLGDYVRDKTIEEIIKDINARFEGLKEVCFSCLGLSDRYCKAERIREFLEFLKFGYGFKFDLNFNTLYDMDFKQIEEVINKTGDIRIRMYKEFYYLSFKDADKMTDLKNRVKKELLQYISRL